MTEHKHAEVLRAIADGKEVQWQQVNEKWIDCDLNIYDPINNHDFEWRVKPEHFAWLDGKEFYDVCQQYRHADDFDKRIISAVDAFEQLKQFIRLHSEYF